ncbi:hypothetical protein B0J11DRAFT_620492 [Dendryphion nanum]|uniref:Mg2+ transporter protein, CorA-like/Zinc transport protein ZntB n=1 Tax=Dendryphion nanum TaxID=256645 RepID=A0A9P9I603_9PLEO|nr:hypothetical protein B0J11DRAFT_620492 [Dendryphion nanum]
MFSAARKAVFDTSLWKEKGGDVDFIEAWSFKNIDNALDQNFRYGSLENDDILRWVRNLDFLPRGYPPEKHELLGKIRLIICRRSQYNPLDFPLSRSIFKEVEQEFHLHPSTLSTFERHAGVYSRHLKFSNTDLTKLERISIILKAPQKREIANYGLSLTHDLDTHITTALLYGTNILIRPESRNGPPDPATHLHRKLTAHTESRFIVPPFLDLIRNAVHAWSHPLLLPYLLLENHMHRIRAFTTYGKMIDETIRIERELGVTKVGQDLHSISEVKGKDLRAKAEELTILINTHSTRIIFTSRSPLWNQKCSEFMLKLLDQLEPYIVHQRPAHHELKELLEYNLVFAEAAVDDVVSIQQRMSLQLNVLYNIVAQMDNALNAKLAAAAGRDSTSMKILAFISATFLPGTFVAGVFSMSMFDWQYSGDGGESGAVVSSKFWVYWVIAIPLTLITLFGWGFWWRVEMKRFEHNFQAALKEKAEEPLQVVKQKSEPLIERLKRVGRSGIREELV